uniref:mRNA cap guanine-N(7) methyltransferase n=1 Tax=Plectus sambesii TaxID=2011161 RepID=A0A914W1V4_9BILA
MAAVDPDHVAQHYNAVPEKGVAERVKSRIFYLRNFNNWTKSMLIGEFLQKLEHNGIRHATVLDLCCGKGGDLLKWKIGRIERLVCADIAEVSLAQCEDRYREMLDRAKQERRQNDLFTAEFISADCSKKRLREAYEQKDIRFDLCSCQFSLHYSFASEQQARRMLQNACESLKPGGYFIGTLPDAARIFHCIKNAPADSAGKYANSVCSVEYEDKEGLSRGEQPPLFGAAFHFTLDEVVNCPEFLVHFPLLEKLLEEWNMELVYKMRFPEAFDKFLKDSKEGRGLLGRMQALEPYPAEEEEDVTPMGDKSEYKTAEYNLSKLEEEQKDGGDSRRPIKIGTLSRSEWEVASMYLVFAFRKKEDAPAV